MGSVFNHNHTKLQPNENIRFDTLSGNCPIGAIYFQTARYTSNNINFSTITSNWRFNIAKSTTYTGNNSNTISINSASDTYGLLLAGNTYNKETYANLYNIYNIYFGSTTTTFSLPVFPLTKLSTDNNILSNVVPVVKNFKQYAAINTNEYKLNG